MLSAATDISVTAINSLKRGEGNPTLGTLLELSHFFKISLDELVGKTPEDDYDSEKEISRIPVYSLSTVTDKDSAAPSGFIKLSCPNYDDQSLFAVEIHNSSMLPFFEKGSVFIISPDLRFTDGDIVLIEPENKSPCLRRAYCTGEILQFHYINLNNQPHTYNNFRVLGTVIKIIQSV